MSPMVPDNGPYGWEKCTCGHLYADHGRAPGNDGCLACGCPQFERQSL